MKYFYPLCQMSFKMIINFLEELGEGSRYAFRR